MNTPNRPRKTPRATAGYDPSKKMRDRAYNRYRRMIGDAGFYQSKQWRDVREMKLNRDPLCEDCMDRGVVTPGVDVDHVKPRKQFPDLAFDLDNLRTLCKRCHGKKTRAEGKA